MSEAERAKHRLYIRKQRDEYGEGVTNDDGAPIDGLFCEHCYCDGNNSCGHECLGDGCALMPSMTCPCCAVEHAPATDAEVDKAAGQPSLFGI